MAGRFILLLVGRSFWQPIGPIGQRRIADIGKILDATEEKIAAADSARLVFGLLVFGIYDSDVGPNSVPSFPARSPIPPRPEILIGVISVVSIFLRRLFRLVDGRVARSWPFLVGPTGRSFLRDTVYTSFYLYRACFACSSLFGLDFAIF